MKKLIAGLMLALCAISAQAQFLSGQVLSAAALNAAFLGISGGTLTGPITVQGLATFNAGITVNGASTFTPPIAIASGGTGANTATGATNNLQYLQGSTGSIARSLAARLQDTISLLDFGADPTDTLDSTTAWANFIAACEMTGKRCEIPAGTYRITSPQTIDLASISPKGIYISGAGQYSAMLDMTSVATSPALRVIDTGNAGGGLFYTRFQSFGIKCNIAGICLQLGKPDFSDALNEVRIEDVWVGNNSTSASAVGIQSNYVLNTHFDAVIAANNGHGDAWQINATAFSHWNGGSGTYGDYGYHLTAGGPGTGAIQGNVFTAIDHEVNAIADVKIDTNNAQGNTWVGGTFVYTPGSTYAFAASAGSDNTVVSPMTLGYPSGTPTYANFFNGATGISLINKFGQTTLYGGQFYLSAPASSSRAMYMQTNGLNRWAEYATGGTEPGSNVGSDYSISRYSDAGTFIDSPFTIVRSTGIAGFADGLTSGASVGVAYSNANITMNDTSSTNKAFIQFQKNGTASWNFGNSSPANTLGIDRYNSSGVYQDTPFSMSQTTGLVSFSDGIAPSTTKGIVGTTAADNANAGSVGEYQTSVSTATSATSGVAMNAATLSLPAGDWDVDCTAQTNPAGTTTTSLLFVGLSLTSATFGTYASGFTEANGINGLSVPAGQQTNWSAPRKRVNLSATTPVYCVAQTTFAVSTMAVSGAIRARRIR